MEWQPEDGIAVAHCVGIMRHYCDSIPTEPAPGSSCAIRDAAVSR
jgi:hypothetical protein